MRPITVKVLLDEERHPDVDTYEFTLDRDDDRWGEVHEYLDRMRDARILEDWTWQSIDTQEGTDVLEFLAEQHGAELENIEGGYEETYSDGGSGGLFRQQMRDAGRGHLLP